MSKIKIVAEIGCNHNGSKQMALRLVDEAAKAGADAVKFQTFISSELVSKYAGKADYQKNNMDVSESQLEMLSQLELQPTDYIEIKKHAENKGLDVFSTAFDLTSIDFLYSIGQSIWKIPSGEITNLPYLEKIRDLKCNNKEIILSTGMSEIKEIEKATEILSESSNTHFVLLHCNTEYPTPDDDMNLLALNYLKGHFRKWSIGLSDHSKGTVAGVASVGMGITFLEKHFTLDKFLPGPDHRASITPDELRCLCQEVRRAECMMGIENKFVTQSEKKNILIARKSIVASRKIRKGEIFSTENITCKRPGNGISPMKWHDILGRRAEYEFESDELIRCDGFPEEDKTN